LTRTRRRKKNGEIRPCIYYSIDNHDMSKGCNEVLVIIMIECMPFCCLIFPDQKIVKNFLTFVPFSSNSHVEMRYSSSCSLTCRVYMVLCNVIVG
jgi:hypothetical protein